MNIVIAGGGTGGHIFGGVAIAQEFIQQSKANKILFIGSSAGLETRLVPKAGFTLETIHVGRLVGQGLFRKILTLAQIPVAVLRCIRILKKFKTNIVIGVGGFASGPCIIAARILSIPVGVLEQNSVVGLTNKISASLAQHVFTAFEEIPLGLPEKKCVATGNPTRSELHPSQSSKTNKPFVLFAFGGSQGATGINKMLVEAASILIHQKDSLQIIHQTGERDYEWVKKAYEDMGYPTEVHRFIDDMQTMYDRCNLVVCRAGSSTIAELGATKNAAVFIPFPYAARNHQEANARLLEKAGAAKVLVQGRDTGLDLAKTIQKLMDNPAEIEKMREQMTHFYRPDAAKRIVEIMKIHVLRPTQ